MHRYLAVGLGVFIVSHFTVHLMALSGPESHISALSTVRPVYQNWIIEPLLVLAILSQVYVGGRLIARRWKQIRKGFWGWLQITSGLYLAMFLLIHSSAALVTRYGVGLDTNFYWAAGTLHSEPLVYVFAPYYFLGVLSVFAHLAAALHFGWPKAGFIPIMLIAGGIAFALLLVMIFGGGFYTIDLPQSYIDLYESYTS